MLVEHLIQECVMCKDTCLRLSCLNLNMGPKGMGQSQSAELVWPGFLLGWGTEWALRPLTTNLGSTNNTLGSCKVCGYLLPSLVPQFPHLLSAQSQSMGQLLTQSHSDDEQFPLPTAATGGSWLFPEDCQSSVPLLRMFPQMLLPQS